MRAFLSHSSKDKKLVEAVFRSLGSYSSHIDSESFEEGKRSAEEIFRTLGGTDVFVLFGSRQSLVSNWVLHELNVAYDRYASGSIRRFLLFLIDDTTIEDLPAWLRSFHVFRAQKAALIARRIRSHIIELRINSGEQVDVFIGRELLLKEVLSVLSLPPDESPSILAFAGWPGIGRRTLAKKILAEAYPYLPAVHPQVNIPTGASTEDFYRRILDVSRGLSLAEWRREQGAFEALSAEEKIELIVAKIVEISTEKEVLFVVDDRGMLASNGEYESWLSKIIAGIPKSIRPMMIFIQQRMTPYAKRRFYQNVYPTHVTSFSDENIRTMLGLLLKQHGVSYTSDQIDELMEYLGGHPINVRFAVGLAKQYGLLAVLRDKTDLVSFSLDRATDILLTLDFSLHAEFVCILLSDYQVLDLDSIMVLLALSDEDTVTCLKFLEEHAVVERTGKYYQIAPYLQEAISRRFSGKHLEAVQKLTH